MSCYLYSMDHEQLTQSTRLARLILALVLPLEREANVASPSLLLHRSSMNRPDYEALNVQGLPYVRTARVVAELPTPEARSTALNSATQEIAERLQAAAQRKIGFGTPVFVAFGLTRPQAKVHEQAKLLLTMGGDLPLDYCHEFN